MDQPPSGTARVEGFFTSRGDAVYAIVPRWPGPQFVIHDAALESGAGCSLLGSQRNLEVRAVGNNVVLSIPQEIRWEIPQAEAYVLKLRGLRGL